MTDRDVAAPGPEPEVVAPSAAPPAAPVAASAVADGVEHALHPKALLLARIQSWIGAAIVAGATGLAAGTAVLLLRTWWAPLLLGLPWLALVTWLALIAHFGTELQHRYGGYRVDGSGIHVRKGMLWRRVVSVPRSRVQHTDVAQGPIERRFGLATLQIFTAGTEHCQVDLEGIDHATAIAIRDHLIAASEDHAV